MQKILKKIKYLWESFWLIVTREGVKSVFVRIYFYIRFGKGVTSQKDYESYAESQKNAPQPLAETMAIVALHKGGKLQQISDPIDVIIPVYNGFEYLDPLFSSLLHNTSKINKIIIIDDQSSDERVFPFLNKIAKDSGDVKLQLEQNKENLGFVRTVNKAVSLTKNHFVILNTDTEVPEGWLERLMQPIVSQKRVASTTPFTNAGTIFSFPETLKDNTIYEGFSVNELDHFMQNIVSGQTVTVPTGMGFCMGFNKDVVAEIGMFDEETFGRGYGEENDWCQRAINVGYKNVAVLNLFVYHKHGASFPSAEKEKLIQENLKKLNTKHPGYDKQVQQFILEDPLKKYRDFLIFLIAQRREGNRNKAVLIVDHELGGGANVYRKRFVKEQIEAEKSVVVLSYDLRKSTYYGTYYNKDYRIAYKFDREEEFDWLLEYMKFEKIILSQNVSFPQPLETLTYLREIAEEKNCPLEFLVHDFFSICPSFNLLNDKGDYCQVPEDLDVCKSCLNNNKGSYRLYSKDTDIIRWREEWQMFLTASALITCFSYSSRDILLRAYPTLDADKIKIQPHRVPHLRSAVYKKKSKKDPLIIGVLGGINHMKGAGIVLEMLEIIGREKMNVRIVILGPFDQKKLPQNLVVHGKFKHDEIVDLTEQYAIDLFLIPSIWPETFSYTTAEIMQMGMPLAVFDLGAPAERVKDYEKGMIIPEISAQSALDTLLLQR